MTAFLNLDTMRQRRKGVRATIRKKNVIGEAKARGSSTGFGSLSQAIVDANIRVTKGLFWETPFLVNVSRCADKYPSCGLDRR